MLPSPSRSASRCETSADRDPLDRLAEEFVARYRRGERPALTEYVERLPDRAEEIRELFPTLVEMEQLKPESGEHTGDFPSAADPADPVRVGEFRILRRVGAGGMGIVYEAVQESLGRRVALKLLHAEGLLDPKRLERFRREARAAARLHHTNIVPVFGVGQAEGRHFYAMQLISGHPLNAVIEEVKRLQDSSGGLPAAPREVSELVAAMATGVFSPAASGESDGEAEVGPGASSPSARAAESGVGSPPLSGSMSEGRRGYWGAVARIGAQAADARDAANQAEEREQEANDRRQAMARQAARQYSETGNRLVSAGDVSGALLWYAAIIRAERQLRLQEALNGMDAMDREILALRHFEELTNRETAAVLGLSKTAASLRYIRALKRLKEILAGLPGLGPDSQAP
jgi:DNA-directed RNA polymerase specialized sigma24 family protein